MRHGFNPWIGKIPWRRAWKPTPVFLPGESHGQKSLVGYSPWSHKESDMTEHTHTILNKGWDHCKSLHPQDPGPQSLPKTKVDRITEKASDPTIQLASTSHRQQYPSAEGMGECEDSLRAHSEALQLRAEEEHWKNKSPQATQPSIQALVNTRGIGE